MMPVISVALEAGFDPEALVGMMRVSRAGAHRLERPPAIGFVDLSGYSRLTEEQGDERAAEVAPRTPRSCGGSLVGTAAWG